jgi:hypothetical protein
VFCIYWCKQKRAEKKRKSNMPDEEDEEKKIGNEITAMGLKDGTVIT